MIQYVDTDAGEYRPGVCNIGPAEIRRRRQIGYLGLAAAVVVAAALVLVDAPSWTRLAVALPVTIALSGFIQAYLRFCAGFAMAGLQNMGQLGGQVQVEDAAARAADRRKAMLINAAAITGGLVAAVAFALLPI